MQINLTIDTATLAEEAGLDVDQTEDFLSSRHELVKGACEQGLVDWLLSEKIPTGTGRSLDVTGAPDSAHADDPGHATRATKAGGRTAKATGR